MPEKGNERDRPRRRGERALLVLVLLALVAGMLWVFGTVLKMRFSSGEIYPHYSSLRSDPLGTRAFREALTSLGGADVRQNLRPLSRIDDLDGNTAVFLLGVPRASLTWMFVTEDDPLLKAVDAGARLVVVVNPGSVPRTEQQTETEWWERQQRIRRVRSGKDGQAGEAVPEDRALLRVLGIDLTVPTTFERPEGGWEVLPTVEAGKQKDFPTALPDWFSQMRLTTEFDQTDEDSSPAQAIVDVPWRTLGVIAESGEPVIAERDYGDGTVVVTSDAFFTSNEALWQGADSEFLLWLTGDKRHIVFDESIHGARRTTGVMQWIRRYRLHGFFAGLLIVVVLFAWSGGASLVPKRNGVDGRGGVVSGEGSDEGLVRLLKRGVPARSLLSRCVALWRESGSPSGAGSGTTVRSDELQKQVDSLLDEVTSPVEGYQQISALLNERSTGGDR